MAILAELTATSPSSCSSALRVFRSIFGWTCCGPPRFRGFCPSHRLVSAVSLAFTIPNRAHFHPRSQSRTSRPFVPRDPSGAKLALIQPSREVTEPSIERKCHYAEAQPPCRAFSNRSSCDFGHYSSRSVCIGSTVAASLFANTTLRADPLTLYPVFNGFPPDCRPRLPVS